MRWVVVLLFVAIAVSSCFAQGGQELEAVMDTFFAIDVKTVLQHLPPEVGEAFAHASPQQQVQVAAALLIRKQLTEKDRTSFSRTESGTILVEEGFRGESSEKKRFEIFLDKRMADGNERMLRFRFRQLEAKDAGMADEGRGPTATAWLRHVDGEWRIYELSLDGDSLHFDDPGFISSLIKGGGSPRANEASAVGSLRTLNTAMVTYTSTYPEIGYPSSISALAGDGGSADRAGLIDPVLGTPPYEKGGYRFTYIPDGSSPCVAYRITARPVETGATGSCSFFTDQSGVIRYTAEDRAPTAEDPPLD